jgi:hypothetical protein
MTIDITETIIYMLAVNIIQDYAFHSDRIGTGHGNEMKAAELIIPV